MLFVAGLILPVLAASAASEPVLLLENGSVYSSPAAAPKKLSILVREGRIAFVGSAAQARRRAGEAEVLDLKGAFVFPGWSDAHGHLQGLGKSLEIARLAGAADPAEAAQRMASAASSLPPEAWAEGRGWDQNRWPGKTFPDARDLDAALPGRPSVARRVDGHAMWVSSAALKAAGIEKDTPDPDGGRILRRPDGTPSGVLIDNAMDLMDRVMPAPSAADLERRFLSAARACAEAGLTQVQDASGYGPAEISALEKLALRGALPIRVYATVSSEKGTLPGFFTKGTRIGRGTDFLTVRAIKAVADGALGSRGAALLEDYSDEPGKKGLLVTSPGRLAEIAREARSNGWQLWIHAIGDRGNRIALDAFREASAAVPKAPAGGERPRIEHAQVVALSDLPRFGEQRVIASVQPTHATSDMPWAEARVGSARIEGAYAWRSLVKAGALLAGGSDFPVESHAPLLGFFAAVTRTDLTGNPPGGWRPNEKLTRKEALTLFTSDAAYAAFEEERRGRITPGYEADLTVLSSDPMTSPERMIPSIPVVLTLVGGKVVFRGGSPPASAP